MQPNGIQVRIQIPDEGAWDRLESSFLELRPISDEDDWEGLLQLSVS